MAGVTASSSSMIDVDSLVSQLMVAEKRPLTKLATKESALQSKISMIGQFKSVISSVQSAAAGLQSLSKLNGIKATLGNSSALSVTASNNADAANYSVDVLQLAKSQQIVSQATKFTSASQALVAKAGETAAAATVTINFGTVTETDGVKSFAADSARLQQISVSGGEDGEISLQEVADAINGGDYGVKASLISDKAGSVRLSLTGDDTGAENAFKIDVAATSGTANAAFNYLNFNPAESSPSFEVPAGGVAVDSKIKLNGVEITRASNTIDDAVEGLTFTLKTTTIPDGSTTSTATTLAVKRDSSAISTQLKTFVDAYNQLANAVKNTTSYDATTKKAGALQGDPTIRSLQNQMRSMVGKAFGNGSGSINTLSDLGVSFQKDGTLALDSTKLGKVVENNLDGVIEFFGAFDQTTSTTAPEASQDGFGYQMEKLAKDLLADDGLIDSKLDGLNKTAKDMQKQYERLEARLVMVEKRYRTQYTALDTSLSKMQGLSDYVAQLQNMMTSSSS